MPDTIELTVSLDEAGDIFLEAQVPATYVTYHPGFLSFDIPVPDTAAEALADGFAKALADKTPTFYPRVD